jgi:hypothetical protein
MVDDKKPKKASGNGFAKSEAAKRAADSSEGSPHQEQTSKTKKKKEKIEDKNKEIEMLKDEIESNKQILEKIKNLSKEDHEKVGLSLEELDKEDTEDEDGRMETNENTNENQGLSAEDIAHRRKDKEKHCWKDTIN